MIRTSAWVLALSTVVACSPETKERAAVQKSALAPEIVIDAATQFQPITGFGASSAWTTQSVSATRADEFFSAETGIGLSLLRIRITPEGGTWEMQTAKEALKRGAAVWAAPWSPPAEWKTTGTVNHGGHLLPEYYEAWADKLADFVALCESQGVPLFALSAQNEPDWVAEWETCEWTPEELATFIGDYLGPTFKERGFTTKILGPESANWDSFPDYSDAILNYPAAKDVVDILATHAYGGVAFDYTPAAQNGKELWETEVSWGDISDDGMENALMMANMMHTHLTLSKVNAWHFWWLQPNGTVSSGSSSLINSNKMTRRGYVLGNFSRFVRPGAVRIGASPATSGTVKTVAFKNANAGPVAVVAINVDDAAVHPFQFRLNGVGSEVGSVTPWVTDQTQALVAQTPVAVTGGVFEYTLPKFSVTTFVTGGALSGTGGSGGTSGSGGSASGGTGGETGVGGTGGSVATGGETGVGGMGGSDPGTGGVAEAGAPGSGGAEASGGSDGSGGSEETGGDSSGGSSPDDETPAERPVTPSVECLCRAPGGGSSSDGRGAWLPVAGLLAVLMQRRQRRNVLA